MIDLLLDFAAWQIDVLPFIIVVSFGTAAILLPIALILLASEDERPT